MSNSPWSVKGVEPEAREAAKLAARKAGMTLGTWLSQTIRAAAAQQLRHGVPPHQPPPSPGPAANEQFAPPPGQHAGAHPGAQPGHPPGPTADPASQYGAPPPGYAPDTYADPYNRPQPPAPTMQALFDSIQRLSSRIEETESRTQDALTPLAEQVKSLSSELEGVKNRPQSSNAPVERAMGRIAERLDRLEEDTARPARRGLFGRRRQA